MPLILSVDDSASMRQVIAFTLRPAGFEVTEAPDGCKALEILKFKNFDLVLTDLHMPLMNGLELIKAARMLPLYKFTPFLFITTECDENRKKEARAAGATGWVIKPFTREQLLATVRKVLK